MGTYIVEVTNSFNARQGLRSPVRSNAGLASLPLENGFQVIMKVGVRFDDDQLTDNGWYIDTDALEQRLVGCANILSGDVWTELFDFRPTFEQVSRWLFKKLQSDVAQLSYVELENVTLGVTTIYEDDSKDRWVIVATRQLL